MSLFGSVPAVFMFELRRAVRPATIFLWFTLAMFPAGLVTLLRYAARTDPEAADPRIWTVVLYGLIPEVMCIGGLLFWMSPSVNAELENRTWIYMAVRPGGRRAVLLGKYLTALVWTISAGWVALSISLPIAHFAFENRVHEAMRSTAPPVMDTSEMPSDVLQEGQVWRSYGVLATLVVLSSIGRGAVFSLIAVIIPQRAMAICFAYAVVFEFVVGMIPALINQFTIQLRLRSLLIHWMNWSHQLPPGVEMLFDPSPALQHVLLLLGLSGLLLLAAVVTLEQRQFPTSDEG